MFSESGLIALVQNLSLEYSATGITDSLRDQILSSFSGMTSSGELRVSVDDPAFFSLTLDLDSPYSKDNTRHISMISHKDETTFAVSSASGSVISKYLHAQ